MGLPKWMYAVALYLNVPAFLYHAYYGQVTLCLLGALIIGVSQAALKAPEEQHGRQ